MSWDEITVLAVVVAAGCGDPLGPPDTDPTIEGEVVALIPIPPLSSSGEGFDISVHVKGSRDPCGIVFRVTEETRIVRTRSVGKPRKGVAADLRVGAVVRVWANGAVAESCPGQALADVIEILLDTDIPR